MNLSPIFPVNQTIDQTNYYWLERGFSSKEVDQIIKDSEKYGFQKAAVVEARSEIRKSNIKWLPYEDRWVWVYDRITNQIIEANNALWHFDLHSFDPIQFTEYRGRGGHYDWHVDIGPAPINHRKVSVVIQLSDPSTYKGGELELCFGNGFFSVPRRKGAVAIFPSFTLHRVTPLTSGLRRTLVVWAGGDHYK